jgi:hypothetical protein
MPFLQPQVLPLVGGGFELDTKSNPRDITLLVASIIGWKVLWEDAKL